MRRCFLLLLFLAPVSALAELDISDGWIKNLPAAVPVRAGYMTIFNPQSQPVSIVALRSESFASVEVHRTLMQDGMMHMEAVPDLTVNPGETVRLAPGGLHLMLMQPVEPTRRGEVHRIFIEFEDGSQQSLEMTVRK